MKKIAFLAVVFLMATGIASAQEKVRVDSLQKDSVVIPTYEELDTDGFQAHCQS